MHGQAKVKNGEESDTALEPLAEQSNSLSLRDKLLLSSGASLAIATNFGLSYCEELEGKSLIGGMLAGLVGFYFWKKVVES